MRIAINKISRLNKGTYLLACIFFVLLEISYRYFVIDFYELIEVEYSFNLGKNILSKVVFVLTIWLLATNQRNQYLHGIAAIFTFFMLIPNLIIYQYNNLSFVVPFSIFLLVFLILISGRINFGRIPANQFSERKSMAIIGGIMFIFFIPAVIHYGFSFDFRVFLLENIYDVREKSIENSNKILNYTIPWLGKIIAPIVLVMAVRTKNKLFLVSSIVVTLYLFLAEAHKSIFFSLFFLLAFSFDSPIEKKVFRFLGLITGLLLLTRLVTILTGQFLFEVLISLRMLFVPAQLNKIYFDFFHNKPLFYSHSILKGFVRYPYLDPDPAFVVGAHYYPGDYAVGANNGIVSDGFMNMGITGVFVNVFVVAAIFRLFAELNLRNYFFGIFIIMITIFISSSLLTTMLTHGCILLILLSVFILPKKRICAE